MAELAAMRSAGADTQSRQMDAPITISTSQWESFERLLRNSGGRDQATNHGENVLPDLQLVDEQFSKCAKPKNEGQVVKCVDSQAGDSNEIKINRPMRQENAIDAEEIKIHRPMMKDESKLDSMPDPKDVGEMLDKAFTTRKLFAKEDAANDLADMARKVLDGGSQQTANERLRMFEESVNANIKAEGKGVFFEMKDGKVSAHLAQTASDAEKDQFFNSFDNPPGMKMHPRYGVLKELAPASQPH